MKTSITTMKNILNKTFGPNLFKREVSMGKEIIRAADGEFFDEKTLTVTTQLKDFMKDYPDWHITLSKDNEIRIGLK